MLRERRRVFGVELPVLYTVGSGVLLVKLGSVWQHFLSDSGCGTPRARRVLGYKFVASTELALEVSVTQVYCEPRSVGDLARIVLYECVIGSHHFRSRFRPFRVFKPKKQT